MITKSTVFILGAGVSMPYGFPSGGQLVREICGVTAGLRFEDNQPGLLNKGEIIQILHNVFGEAKTEEFGTALHYSQKYSIDSFLEQRPEFTEIGKWAIALFILRKEIHSNLFSFENQDEGCYRYLFDKLNTSKDSLINNKVSFITFNYDRSLEHFLFKTHMNIYGKNSDECAEAISKIPIIHIHGSLGQLPWQSPDGISYGADIGSYSEKISIGNAAAARTSKQIKVILENQSHSEPVKEAYELLSKAERIYFLGFSYHPENMEKLGLKTLIEIEKQTKGHNILLSRFKGTGYNLETKELEAAKNWFVNIPDTQVGSLLFLRRYADLD